MKKVSYNVDYFLNIGCEECQSIWAIYPRYFSSEKLTHLLNIAESTLIEQENDFLRQARNLVLEIKRLNDYVDPMRNKVFSKWYFANVDDGAILYCFGSDGRVDTANRLIVSIEGIYINDIDIEKTVIKYQNLGIDIVDLIGKQIPEHMEKIILDNNASVYEKMYATYKENGNLDLLFPQFYAQQVLKCGSMWYSSQGIIESFPLCKINLFSNLFK